MEGRGYLSLWFLIRDAGEGGHEHLGTASAAAKSLQRASLFFPIYYKLSMATCVEAISNYRARS